MQITQARYESGSLILSTTDQAARRLVYNFKPGDYELTKSTKKRSLDANRLCWKLCTDIADAIGISKEEVYRRSIKDGGEYTPLPIKADAVDEFCKIWSGHGVGWFAEVVDDGKIDGYKLLFAYHGSSTYSTKAMSQLIDRLMQDATALGIETLSEREISLIVETWGEKND